MIEIATTLTEMRQQGQKDKSQRQAAVLSIILTWGHTLHLGARGVMGLHRGVSCRQNLADDTMMNTHTLPSSVHWSKVQTVLFAALC